MSETKPGEAAGSNPFGSLAQFTLAATERNMELARDWSRGLLTMLEEQSEDTQATLATLVASLEAMERALASQEETNRALRESLQGYRQMVDRFVNAQERTARLVQTSVEDLKAAGEAQMEATRALLTPTSWPPDTAAATEPFTQLMKAWTEAFSRFGPDRPTDPRSS